jgi:nucleoside phosphorylase
LEYDAVVARLRPFTVVNGGRTAVHEIVARSTSAKEPSFRRIVATQIGIDETTVRRNLERTIEAHRPAEMVLIGYCGGLDPSLRTGDLVVADELASESVAAPTRLASTIAGRLAVDWPIGETKVRSGRLLSVDRPIYKPSNKRFWFERTSAIVVDVEARWVHEIAASTGVRFLVTRVVFDEATDSLPADAMNWLTDAGDLDGWALTADLLRRPFEIGRLVSSASRRRKADRTIGALVDCWRDG